jgi:amino acid transporter/nucleotide-binding universal stress UspA family protein
MLNGLGYAELAIGVSRVGGAYRLVYRATGDAAPAFLTGWALILSGLGLCAVLAQSAAQHLEALASPLVDLPVPTGALATGAVLILVVANVFLRRRKQRAGFALLALIGLVTLALLAIPQVKPTNLRVGPLQVRTALPALMVAFVGLELITSFQREIRRRGANLPRALLVAPLVAAGLGAVLVTVAVGVAGWDAIAAHPTPLALVGEAVAGRWGQTSVLVFGCVVTILALNQGLLLVVRQLFVMSRDGFLPAWLGRVNYRRRAPVHAILLAGLLILPVVWLPTYTISRVGGLLYLAVLISINLALVRRSREPVSQPASEGSARRRFRLPFHPWIPAVTVAIDLLAIALWGLAPAAYAVGCLGIGGLVYLLYGRGRRIQSQEGVTVFRSTEPETRGGTYTVLVPVANPATASALLRLAESLARTHDGEVIALRVEVVPDPIPLEAGRRRGRAGQALMEQAMSLANQEDLPLRTVTRVARSVAEGILDAASDEHADLILTGWRGPLRSRETSLGGVLDAVLRDAACDVLIVRGESVAAPERILVPSAGGPHARAATRLALALAEAAGGEVTLLSILSSPASDELLEERRRQLADTLQGLSPSHPPSQKVVVAQSIVEGIVQEAREHDLVLLGVSEESLLDRLVFGNVPLQVASRVAATGLVQGNRGVTYLEAQVRPCSQQRVPYSESDGANRPLPRSASRSTAGRQLHRAHRPVIDHRRPGPAAE